MLDTDAALQHVEHTTLASPGMHNHHQETGGRDNCKIAPDCSEWGAGGSPCGVRVPRGLLPMVQTECMTSSGCIMLPLLLCVSGQ